MLPRPATGRPWPERIRFQINWPKCASAFGMQPRPDCRHDHFLGFWPVMHDLGIAKPQHGVSQRREYCIVSVVFVSLHTNMRASVDLQNQTLAQEKIHSSPFDPGLSSEPNRQLLQSEPHVRF